MFTRDQIEEIKKKLIMLGTKDTQFPDAHKLNGEEIIAIVQDGENKKIPLSSIINDDFINVSKDTTEILTLSTAVSKIDINNRKLGQVITFKDSANSWAIRQFTGSSLDNWNDISLWKSISGIDELKSQVETNAEDISVLSDEIERHDASILNLNTDVSKLKDKDIETSSSLSELNTKVDTLKSQADANTSNISSLNTNVSALQSKVDGNTTSISQINTELDNKNDEITQINNTLAEHTESINAKITTDRIQDGAVTSEKIATSAFDSTLSVSGKIAPADIVGEKLSELDETINGEITKTFDHSTFESNGKSPIDEIILSNVGDYTEVLAKVSWISGLVYIVRNSSSIYTAISYSGANKIFVRLMSGGQTITAQNDAYKDKTKIKVVLDNISGSTYNYKVYVNDVAQTGFATSSSPAKFNQCGTAQMDLYYVKYKMASAENTIGEFGKIIGAEGISDHYTLIEGEGIKQDIDNLTNTVIPYLNERISKLENCDNMFYSFTLASKLWDCDSHFTIYQKISGNKYIGTNIGLYSYKKRGLSDERYYWRMVASNLYTYADGVMTKGIEMITSGENEFVLQWQGDDKTAINYDSQYSGGFHGGEYCNMENCYVKFMVNGKEISIPTEDIPLTSISSFSYCEKSAIKEKSSGSIGCYHMKETIFGNGGYRTENRIDLQMSIPFFAYFGIVCVNRNISEYAMPEKANALTLMGSGTPTIVEQFKSNNHKIIYQGNGLQTEVTSKIDYGDDDNANELVVYNSTQYNKYYRKSQVIPANALNKVKGTTIVKIEDL